MSKDTENKANPIVVPYGSHIIFNSSDGDPGKSIAILMGDDSQLYDVRNNPQPGQSYAQAITRPVSELKESPASSSRWAGPSIEQQLRGITTGANPNEDPKFDNSGNSWW